MGMSLAFFPWRHFGFELDGELHGHFFRDEDVAGLVTEGVDLNTNAALLSASAVARHCWSSCRTAPGVRTRRRARALFMRGSMGLRTCLALRRSPNRRPIQRSAAGSALPSCSRPTSASASTRATSARWSMKRARWRLLRRLRLSARLRRRPPSASTRPAARATAAGAVGAAAGAVVAVFLGLNDVVTAERAELAAHVALAVAAVVDAVVALLAEAQDAVAANRRAVTRRGFEARQRQAERRAVLLALGLEHHDLVHVARREAEAGRRRGVDGDRAIHRHVDAAEVHREVAVDEHPNVVVTREVEARVGTRLVAEPVLHFAREVEVVLRRAGENARPRRASPCSRTGGEAGANARPGSAPSRRRRGRTTACRRTPRHAARAPLGGSPLQGLQSATHAATCPSNFVWQFVSHGRPRR